MPLDKDSIKATYSTDKDNILGGFYIPVLNNATSYDRAVGYFSTEALLWIIQGLDGLIKNEGTMRLVVGSRLDDDEYEAIRNNDPSSLEVQEKIYKDFSNKWDELINSDMYELKKYRLAVFSWLAITNKLEIKFALRKKGIFHKKIGVVKGDDFTVVFSGSLNETESAFEHNSENFDVYRSWREQAYEDHGEPHLKEFEDVWNGTENDTITLDVPSKCYDDIKNYWNLDRPPITDLEKEAAKKIAEMFKKKNEEDEKKSIIEYDFIEPRFPKKLGGKPYKIHKHQRIALTKWKEKNYRGIMALATGAGKTITSIHGAVEIAQNNKIVLIISVPYIVLAEQWVEVLRLFNINPVKCWSSGGDWNSGLTREINNFNLGFREFLSVVVVNASIKNINFQDQLRKISLDQMIFIGDECHHHDEKGLENKLPNANYRLGLSATPWSENEISKKESLESYYGEIVETYTLQRAMKENILTQYKYYIYPVSLNEEEAEAYEKMSKNILKMIAMKNDNKPINEGILQNLIFKRSRLLDSLENKFTKLEEIIKTKKPSPYTLFYSGSGSVESTDDQDPENDDGTKRSISIITTILDKYHWNTSHFTSQESPSKRASILKSFKNGSIDAIAAIKVLDEGFDVPMCREAYITASSRNERQFIQRRGRILRKADGKKEAIIHDFVILHHDNNPVYKTLVENELKRVKEFYDSALNQDQLLPQINKIIQQFNITIDLEHKNA